MIFKAQLTYILLHVCIVYYMYNCIHKKLAYKHKMRYVYIHFLSNQLLPNWLSSAWEKETAPEPVGAVVWRYTNTETCLDMPRPYCLAWPQPFCF